MARQYGDRRPRPGTPEAKHPPKIKRPPRAPRVTKDPFGPKPGTRLVPGKTIATKPTRRERHIRDRSIHNTAGRLPAKVATTFAKAQMGKPVTAQERADANRYLDILDKQERLDRRARQTERQRKRKLAAAGMGKYAYRLPKSMGGTGFGGEAVPTSDLTNAALLATGLPVRGAFAGVRGLTSLAKALRPIGSEAHKAALVANLVRRGSLAKGAIRGLERPTAGGAARTLLRGAKGTPGALYRNPSKALLGAGVSPLVTEAPLAKVRGQRASLGAALSGQGQLASITATKAGASAGGTIGNLGKDFLNLPAQMLPSMYIPLAAGIAALGGDSKRWNELITQLKKTDPLGALVLGGDPVAAAKAAQQHPLFAALEGAGVYGGAGRGAGYAMRRGIAGPRGRAYAEQLRRPLEFPGRRLEIGREYSPNVISKRVQVALENRQARRFGQEAGLRAQGVKPKGRLLDPIRRARLDLALRTALDRTVRSSKNMLLRKRDDVIAAARQFDAGKSTEAVGLTAANVLRATSPDQLRADAQRFIEEWKPIRDAADPDLVDTVRLDANLQALDRVARIPGEAEKVMAAAEAFKNAQKPAELMMYEQATIDWLAGLRRAEEPWAVTHGGGTLSEGSLMMPPDSPPPTTGSPPPGAPRGPMPPPGAGPHPQGRPPSGGGETFSPDLAAQDLMERVAGALGPDHPLVNEIRDVLAHAKGDEFLRLLNELESKFTDAGGGRMPPRIQPPEPPFPRRMEPPTLKERVENAVQGGIIGPNDLSAEGVQALIRASEAGAGSGVHAAEGLGQVLGQPGRLRPYDEGMQLAQPEALDLWETVDPDGEIRRLYGRDTTDPIADRRIPPADLDAAWKEMDRLGEDDSITIKRLKDDYNVDPDRPAAPDSGGVKDRPDDNWEEINRVMTDAENVRDEADQAFAGPESLTETSDLDHAIQRYETGDGELADIEAAADALRERVAAAGTIAPRDAARIRAELEQLPESQRPPLVDEDPAALAEIRNLPEGDKAALKQVAEEDVAQAKELLAEHKDMNKANPYGLVGEPYRKLASLVIRNGRLAKKGEIGEGEILELQRVMNDLEDNVMLERDIGGGDMGLADAGNPDLGPADRARELDLIDELRAAQANGDRAAEDAILNEMDQIREANVPDGGGPSDGGSPIDRALLEADALAEELSTSGAEDLYHKLTDAVVDYMEGRIGQDEMRLRASQIEGEHIARGRKPAPDEQPPPQSAEDFLGEIEYLDSLDRRIEELRGAGTSISKKTPLYQRYARAKEEMHASPTVANVAQVRNLANELLATKLEKPAKKEQSRVDRLIEEQDRIKKSLADVERRQKTPQTPPKPAGGARQPPAGGKPPTDRQPPGGGKIPPKDYEGSSGGRVPITTPELIQRRVDAGLPAPGFVSGRIAKRTRRPAHRGLAARAAAGRYTGDTLLKGQQPGDITTLVNTITGQHAFGEGVRLRREMQENFGQRMPDEKLIRVKNEEDYARKLANGDYKGILDPKEEYALHPYIPEKLPEEQVIKAIEKHMDRGNPEAYDLDAFMELTKFDEHLNDRAKREDGYILIRKKDADRFAHHLNSSNLDPVTRGMRAWQSAFKSAVLPTSTKWLAGNAFDVSMRGLLAGVAPPGAVYLDPRFRFMKDLKKIMEDIDKEGADRWFSSLGLRGHYGSQAVTPNITGREGQSLKRNMKDLIDGIAHARVKPSVTAMMDLYRRYRDTVYHFNTKFIEETPQMAFLGKQIKKEVRQKLARWDRTHESYEAALRDVAKGLLKTKNQERFAEKLSRQFGDWSTMSPFERRFMMNYAPFYLWARAATKFVVMTLPRDHPVFTALASSANAMTEEERRRFGFDLFYKKAGSNLGPLPRFLQGGLPSKRGIKNLAYSTTFGVWADYPAALSTFILPHASAAIWAGSGLDFTGDHIVNADGTAINPAQKAGLIAYFLVEPLLPFAAMARTMLRGDREHRSWFPLTGYHGKRAPFKTVAGHALIPSPIPGSKSYPPGLTNYLRWQQAHAQQIWVPIKGGPQAPGRSTKKAFGGSGTKKFGEKSSSGGLR